MTAVAGARDAGRPAALDLGLTAGGAAPPVQGESNSPPVYVEPGAINDNEDDLAPAPRVRRRRRGVLQTLVWVLIAPLYLAVAVA